MTLNLTGWKAVKIGTSGIPLVEDWGLEGNRMFCLDLTDAYIAQVGEPDFMPGEKDTVWMHVSGKLNYEAILYWIRKLVFEEPWKSGVLEDIDESI